MIRFALSLRFFNLFLGMQFRRFWNFRSFADSKSSLNPKNSKKLRKPHRNYFDCFNTKIIDSANRIKNAESSKYTPPQPLPQGEGLISNSASLAFSKYYTFPLPCGGGLRGWVKTPNPSLRGARSEASATKQSKLFRLTLRSEISKTRESGTPRESMTEKRINKLDSPLQQNDSNNLTPCALDSSLHASRFAQNDKVLDYHDFTFAESRNDEAVADSRFLDSSLVSLDQNDKSIINCLESLLPNLTMTTKSKRLSLAL